MRGKETRLSSLNLQKSAVPVTSLWKDNASSLICINVKGA